MIGYCDGENEQLELELLQYLKDRFEEVSGEKTYQSESGKRQFWLKEVADNLCSPMSEKTLDEIGYHGDHFDFNLAAIRSSKAMIYNILGNGSVELRGTGRLGAGTYEIEYEKKIVVLNTDNSEQYPAAIDAFLYCQETGEAIAIEAKCLETYVNDPRKKTYVPTRSYYDPDNYFYERSDVSFSELAKDLRYLIKEGLPTQYDATQMFRHAVACYNLCANMINNDQKISKLTLLNCTWKLPHWTRISKESQEVYRSLRNSQLEGWKAFRDLTRLILTTVFNDIDIDFRLMRKDVKKFIECIKKDEDELEWLRRYYD